MATKIRNILTILHEVFENGLDYNILYHSVGDNDHDNLVLVEYKHENESTDPQGYGPYVVKLGQTIENALSEELAIIKDVTEASVSILLKDVTNDTITFIITIYLKYK